MSDTMHALTLNRVLEAHARAYPTKMAVIDGDLRLTYPAFRDRIARLAGALRTRGIGTGDRVLWLGQNSFRVLETLLACARVGAILCPANWRQTSHDMAFVIDDLEPKLILWQDEEIGATVQAARNLARHRDALWLQHDAAGDGAYESFVASGTQTAPDLDGAPADPVLGIYTAAFDGHPNAALLSQTALLAQGLVVAKVTDFRERTVFLASGPLFHIGTFKFMMSCFHMGGTNVFIRRTDALHLCEVIHKERCTTAFLVTQTMLDMAEINKDRRFDLSSLHSAPVAAQWDEMVQVIHFDYDRAAGYGQTEVTGFVLWQYFGGGGIGPHGRPSPVAEVKILDEDGNEVPDGSIGEIAVRGPVVMNGYWRRPELNARRQRGGWHRCNDLGRREADGTFTFIGPKVQMIKSGVENIYPAEVEACLKSHPAVADCGIIGVPDPKWIQSVKAIVQLKTGSTATADEMIEYCRDRIASYKKPRSIVFTNHIPRTASFAVDYRALDAAYGGGNYPGGGTPSK